MDFLAHANPGLKILEIGAGTGSATRFMLDRVTQQLKDGSYAPRLERYVFTDISPGFFDKAKHTFDQYLDRMEFATLDIERDPLVQGFQENEYDVVVASDVSQYPQHQILSLTNMVRRFYATSDLSITLTNVRKLLRPCAEYLTLSALGLAKSTRGGKLILSELENSAVTRTDFVFGLLPGWCRSKVTPPMRIRGPY